MITHCKTNSQSLTLSAVELHMYLYSCWQSLAACSSGAEWSTFNVAQRLLRQDMLRLYGNKKLLIQRRMSLNTASRHVVWGLYFIQVATCQTTSSLVSCCSAHAVPCSPSCSSMYTHSTLSTACPFPSHFHLPTHSLTRSRTHALCTPLFHMPSALYCYTKDTCRGKCVHKTKTCAA